MEIQANELMIGAFVYFNCFDGSRIVVRVTGLPIHVNKHGVTRQSKSVTRKNLKCMVKVLRKCGFS